MFRMVDINMNRRMRRQQPVKFRMDMSGINDIQVMGVRQRPLNLATSCWSCSFEHLSSIFYVQVKGFFPGAKPRFEMAMRSQKKRPSVGGAAAAAIKKSRSISEFTTTAGGSEAALLPHAETSCIMMKEWLWLPQLQDVVFATFPSGVLQDHCGTKRKTPFYKV